MNSRSPARAACILLACALAFLASPALAQIAHHPFAIGANEGAVGHQTGLGAWILGQESRFYLGLTGAVRAVKTSPTGLVLLIGLSFAYGVFHAAGPGHGKAVITSYMVSNEVALRRGLLISLCAALLQGLVATALVGIAAYVFDATAQRMTAAAQVIEFASYLGIVALGLLLVWRKGRGLVGALRPAPAPLMVASTGPSVSLGVMPVGAMPVGAMPVGAMPVGAMPFGTMNLGTMTLPGAGATTSRFFADDGTSSYAMAGHDADCDCGHAHMPDPALFGGRRFDWKAASIAVVTAGARPCSGAILVLVFSLSQGLFVAGVAATFAMALGTAITTGALAATAVFAKDVAMRLSGGTAARLVIGRLVEFGAAACVLLFGIALLAASLTGAHGGG